VWLAHTLQGVCERKCRWAWAGTLLNNLRLLYQSDVPSCKVVIFAKPPLPVRSNHSVLDASMHVAHSLIASIHVLDAGARDKEASCTCSHGQIHRHSGFMPGSKIGCLHIELLAMFTSPVNTIKSIFLFLTSHISTPIQCMCMCLQTDAPQWYPRFRFYSRAAKYMSRCQQ
jgi:hypothetical protein